LVARIGSTAGFENKGDEEMAVQVYINFNGNCREAVEFYAEVFVTEKPEIMTYGETPPEPGFVMSEKAKELVMHTRLNICGSTVMFSDVLPGMPYVAGSNINLTILSPSMEEVKSVFNSLSEGGSVHIDLQETFWSKCYGSLTDKFGITWQFSHDESASS